MLHQQHFSTVRYQSPLDLNPRGQCSLLVHWSLSSRCHALRSIDYIFVLLVIESLYGLIGLLTWIPEVQRPPPCSRYKSSQNIWWPLGLFRKASFLSKNYCGYVLDSFWINLGYFYFQYLVTLNTAYNELLLSHFGFIGQKSSSLSTSNSSFHLLWAIIYQPIRWKQNNTLREKEFDSFEFQR